MGWGDELMVTGYARELQARDPRLVRPDYERPRDHEAWFNNPRIAPKGERGDFQNYPARVGGLRPYMVAKGPDRYHWKKHQAPRGELYFDEKEKRFARGFAGRVIIEPRLKGGASINKDWGWGRWLALVALMRKRGIEPALLGSASQPQIPGVEFIHTNSMRYAAAVMSTARAAVLPEGGLHHVAAAVGCPAVVIFGGYISPEVTGYPEQKNLFVPSEEHPIGCGWRTACTHCQAAMASISPEMVVTELEGLLEKR